MLRKVPVIILVALALDVLFSLANIGIQLTSSATPNWDGIDRWHIVEGGGWMMVLAMMAVGLRDLADRVWGTANRMAKLASTAYLVLLALEIGFMLMSAFQVGSENLWKVESYLFWVVATGTIVALFIAGARRGPAIAGLVLAVISHPPELISRPLFEALSLGYHGSVALHSVQGIVNSIGLLLLVMSIPAGAAAHVPQRAVQGFRRAGSGFTLRLVAAVGSVLFVLLAAGASGSAALSLVKLVLIGGLVVNMIASALIGLGALDAARSSLEGIAKPVVIASGAASLWCAGAMCSQLPYYYQLLYGSHSSRDGIQVLAIALPLVGALGTAVLATVIGGLGRARANDALARSGTASGIGYLALTLAAIGLQNYMLESARTKASAIGILLVAAAAGLAAQVIMAKLCRRAAEAAEAEPGLPMARVTS